MYNDEAASAGEPLERSQGGETARWLREWLSRASPEVSTLVRHAALPHSIDPESLSRVTGVPDASAGLAALARAEIVTTGDGVRYRMRSSARRLLVEEWMRTDVVGYRSAHARFASDLAQRSPSDLAAYVELSYHQLGAGDELGLESLGAAFQACLNAGRPGLAERLLAYAREHVAVLAPATQNWLRYYEARLALAHADPATGATRLQTLLNSQLPPDLEALVHLHLGQALVAEGRWNEAFGHLDSAEVMFAGLHDEWQATRAAEAHGVALVNLAASLGGPTESYLLAPEPWFRQLLEGMLHAPFLLYRWLSRRMPFIPNLYFGTNYQSWMIIRLMYRALGRYKGALDHLDRLEETAGAPALTLRSDLQIRIADLQHRVGEWTRANRLLAHLERVVSREDDDYRWATLRLAQGRAQVAMERYAPARSLLEEAQEVFRQYEDRSSLAHTSALLGNVAQASGDLPGALSHYAESASAALDVDDLLAATSTAALIDTLRARSFRNRDADGTAEPLSEENPLATRLARRAYIARFTGPLLSLFRWAAILGAALTLILILRVYSGLFEFLAQIIEAFFQAAPGAVTDLVLVALGTLFMIALAAWLYEFLYLLLGWLIVRRLQLGVLERYQPELVITAPEGIALRKRDGSLDELAWVEVSQWTSMDVAVWRGPPIALVSRQILVGSRARLVINGTTSDYAAMKVDIMNRLAHRSR